MEKREKKKLLTHQKPRKSTMESNTDKEKTLHCSLPEKWKPLELTHMPR